MADWDPSSAQLKRGSLAWWLARLNTRLDKRKKTFETLANYYEGRHPLIFATDRFTAAFGSTLLPYADNFVSRLVDAVTERLFVEGFRVAGDDAGSDVLWRIWQANRMDTGSQLLFREALVKREASVIVWTGDERDTPRMTVEDPLQVVVETEPGDRLRRVAALKRWTEDEASYCTLYLPDGIYKFQDPSRSRLMVDMGLGPEYGNWRRREVADEPWPLPNPTGVVPVVPIINRPKLNGEGRSEIEPVIPLQDAINKTGADMLIASEFSAFRQRWATGLDIPTNPDTGEPVEAFQAAVERLWTTSDKDVRFGEFGETNLVNYVKAIEMQVQHLGSVGGLPLHYLLNSGVVPSGEALALDTSVQTPDGPVAIAEIEVGDRVFDDRGDVQTVEHVFAVMHDRPCYRVAFDDGSSIVADAAHKWFTVPYGRARKSGRGSVVTTEEMAATLHMTNSRGALVRAGRKRGPVSRHAIPVAGALDLPDVDLPVDPYALGVWLGDGDSADATITQSEADAPELVAHLAAAGVVAVHRPPRKPGVAFLRLGIVPGSGLCHRGHERAGLDHCPACAHLNYRQRRYGEPLPPQTNVPFRRKLIQLGVIGAKHIPAPYYRASHRQRLGLLQGIMDTDGTCARGGSLALDLYNERLARDVHRLIMSLGHKCAIRRGPGRFGTTRWRMAWTAPEPVFRLGRKLDRQRFARGGSSRYRYVSAVDPLASVPVRCIAVSGPSHLFLVSDAHIPTHNSQTAAESPLVNKVRDRQGDYSDPLEEVQRLVFLVMDDQTRASRPIETVWRDPERRTPSEFVDSLMKEMALGVPPEILWEKRGYTRQEIARIKTINSQRALEAAANQAEMLQMLIEQGASPDIAARVAAVGGDRLALPALGRGEN